MTTESHDGFKCIICKEVKRDVEKIADDIFICDVCKEKLANVFTKLLYGISEKKRDEQSATRLLRCSFCGKSESDVKKLIAGCGVYICDECVRICQEILDADDVETPVADKDLSKQE